MFKRLLVILSLVLFATNVYGFTFDGFVLGSHRDAIIDQLIGKTIIKADEEVIMFSEIDKKLPRITSLMFENNVLYGVFLLIPKNKISYYSLKNSLERKFGVIFDPGEPGKEHALLSEEIGLVLDETTISNISFHVVACLNVPLATGKGLIDF